MEKPILFNTEMVKAILEGRKTETRRVMKPQPTHSKFAGFVYASGDKRDIGKAMFVNSFPAIGEDAADYIRAPYQIGDILYVRETWCKNPVKNEYMYKANKVIGVTKGFIKWKPSIHMPKVAARIFLKVTDVRVERLQDITEDGAKEEGVIKQLWYQPYGTRSENHQKYVGDLVYQEPNYKTGFADIWDRTLNKLGDWVYSFKENPWVWVIEFERI